MFDPTVGRWLEEDPEGFAAGDPNLFRYVGNSPTNATDPSGRSPFGPVIPAGKVEAALANPALRPKLEAELRRFFPAEVVDRLLTDQAFREQYYQLFGGGIPAAAAQFLLDPDLRTEAGVPPPPTPFERFQNAAAAPYDSLATGFTSAGNMLHDLGNALAPPAWAQAGLALSGLGWATVPAEVPHWAGGAFHFAANGAETVSSLIHLDVSWAAIHEAVYYGSSLNDSVLMHAPMRTESWVLSLAQLVNGQSPVVWQNGDFHLNPAPLPDSPGWVSQLSPTAIHNQISTWLQGHDPQAAEHGTQSGSLADLLITLAGLRLPGRPAEGLPPPKPAVDPTTPASPGSQLLGKPEAIPVQPSRVSPDIVANPEPTPGPAPAQPPRPAIAPIPLPVVPGPGTVVAGQADKEENKACFAAGTPLRTPDGWRNIEALAAGDLVLARDEFDSAGEVLAKLVEEVFVTQGLVWHLHAGGQVIRTTAEHPFYVRGVGWVPCNQLKVGDWLVTEDGLCVRVDDLLDTGEYETLYNVRVADFHTYFVGNDEWGFAVWAHNACAIITESVGTWPGNVQIPNDLGNHWDIRVTDNHGMSERTHLVYMPGAVVPPNGFLHFHPNAWISNWFTPTTLGPILGTHTVKLTNTQAANAIAWQRFEIMFRGPIPGFPFNIITDGCSTHIWDVLDAAGVAGLPPRPTRISEAVGLVRFLQTLPP